MLNKIKLYNIILNLVLFLFCLIISRSEMIEYGWAFYVIQIICFTISIFYLKNNSKIFLSPSYITLMYLSLNFVIGHYVVSNGLGFDLRYYSAFKNYSNYKFITIYLLLCNLIVFMTLNFRAYKRIEKLNNYNAYGNKSNLFTKKIVIFLILIILSNFFKLDLSIIGGAGDFSYVLKLSFTIYLVYNLARSRNKFRWIIYSLIFIIFVISHYDSKREFLYVLLLIIFFEIFYNKINFRINLKTILLSICFLFFILYAVVVSSITRGYGNFNTSNPIESIKYVPKYLESDYATKALINNFELNTVYGNGSNSINYVYDDQVDLLYGSTFLKFIFIPIPRSLFPDKPRSMIDIYTTKFDPGFRQIGGSLPVIIYSEVFWNFHLIGLIFLYFIYRIFDVLYRKIFQDLYKGIFGIKTFILVYLYITIIQFIRGSGFDIWLLYCLIALPFAVIINFFLYKIKS